MLFCKTFTIVLVCTRQVYSSTPPAAFRYFTESRVISSAVRGFELQNLFFTNSTLAVAAQQPTTVADQLRSTFTTVANKTKMSVSNSTSVAVCQFTAKNNKEENFNTCKSLIESATTAGAKVIFLPEACDYMPDSKEEALNLSEPLDGELVSKYKELAKTLKVWLSLGGIHERVDDGKVRNSHVIINDDGLIVAVYRKLHLFDVEIPEKNIRLKESDYVKRGEEIVKPVPSPIGEIGLGICYDMRFPEMSLVLRNLGAQVLTYPSAFTFATGAIHWEVLLRSRAIENQCYVIAAAQTGMHNKKRQSWGHAMVIDPLGNIIAQCSEGAGFVLANIDFKVIENTRKTMPVKDHRRTDIYPEMLPNSKTALFGIKENTTTVYADNKTINFSSNGKEAVYQFGQVSIPDSCVFYKSNLSMAFVNKRCVVPGHVLVAPFRPAPRLADLTSEEVSDLFLTVQKVESVMERVHGAGSTTIAVQDGPDAGRTIMHVHVHVLPRKKGDFLQNDQIYYELQHHDKNEQNPWRDEKEMTSEASELKKFFS